MVLGINVNSGDEGISVAGDGNTVNSYRLDINSNRVIPRSLLRDICVQIANMDVEESDYSIQGNSDWMKKFEYNSVTKYIEIFDEYSDGYDSLCDVLSTYPDSTLMIKKIRTVYLKIKPTDNTNGDFILEQIFDILKNELCTQDFFNTTNLFDEEIDSAIYLIMFYAFTKCKILEVVTGNE